MRRMNCLIAVRQIGARLGTGFALPAIALGLLGLGAGVAMPAAVGALMSTIPPEKAGVGSALNDTIQQAGSALGIALLGSLLAAGYTRHMPAGAPGQAGIGIDPRQMSGRLAVVVESEDGGAQTPDEAAARLRRRGYRVDVLRDEL